MGTSKKQKKRDGLRYREFVLSPYGVIKIKSLGYIAGVNTFEGKTATGRGGEVGDYSAFSKA